MLHREINLNISYKSYGRPPLVASLGNAWNYARNSNKVSDLPAAAAFRGAVHQRTVPIVEDVKLYVLLPRLQNSIT